MTRPSPDEQPTTVLPQTTVEQPTVATAPATRRARVWRHIPSRVGRARTSTLVIGCLFVLLLGLNAALPRGESGTTNVVLPSGQTVPVPNSALPSDPAPTPATTTRPSRTSGTSTAPDEDERTTAPATTADEPGEEAPRSSSTPSAESTPTSRAPSSSRASASTRAPATTAAPTSAEPTG
jgi:hypothetical protein